MLNYSNPYDVLSETISFENVQLMGEMITLKTLRRRYAYARYTLEWLYVGLVQDLNRSNNPAHTFSDAYDLVQTAICFLCDFIGKNLNDIYMVKNGQEITIKRATYLLVNRHIEKMRRHLNRTRDINDFAEELSVDIDRYQEKDYTNVDNRIERLGLKPRDRTVLDCYLGFIIFTSYYINGHFLPILSAFLIFFTKISFYPPYYIVRHFFAVWLNFFKYFFFTIQLE